MGWGHQGLRNETEPGSLVTGAAAAIITLINNAGHMAKLEPDAFVNAPTSPNQSQSTQSFHFLMCALQCTIKHACEIYKCLPYE